MEITHQKNKNTREWNKNLSDPGIHNRSYQLQKATFLRKGEHTHSLSLTHTHSHTHTHTHANVNVPTCARSLAASIRMVAFPHMGSSTWWPGWKKKVEIKCLVQHTNYEVQKPQWSPKGTSCFQSISSNVFKATQGKNKSFNQLVLHLEIQRSFHTQNLLIRLLFRNILRVGQ